MKKLLVLIFLVLNINTNAQYSATTPDPYVLPFAFNIHGGYSWLDGVLGADLQWDNLGISGGWMPNTMPLSGRSVPSYSIAASCYSGHYYENSVYLSIGVASTGYLYEDSYGYEETMPMTIVMGGYKWAGENLYLKMGVGYGWCNQGNTWTGEITLGYTLFRTYKLNK